MHTALPIRAITTCFLAWSVTVAAQNTPQAAGSDEASEPPLYQIELIVFRHLDQSRNTGEIPRATMPEASAQLEQDLARLSGSETGLPFEGAEADDANDAVPAVDEEPQTDTEDKVEPPVRVPANRDALLLSRAASSIDDIAAYELVTYLAWAQSAPEVSMALPFSLDELGADTSALSGTVELHERRYLHLVVDVILEADSGESAALTGPSFAFARDEADSPALRDSRRIRLNRAQYFDQPQFGILAMVSRYEAPAETPAETLGATVP